MFFGIVVFGTMQGLVLLPVLLSLVGPAHIATANSASTRKGPEMSTVAA